MTKNKYFISLKNDEELVSVFGDASTHIVEDKLFIEIHKNKDGFLYAFFDRRNNQTGSNYYQVWILDSVDRLNKALRKVLGTRKYYPSVKWNIETKPFASFDSMLKDAFEGYTFAPKYISAKWGPQPSHRFDLHNGVWVG